MGKLFNIFEIIKLAIEKEKESITLYEDFAISIKNKKIKYLFNTLAQEEKKHEVFYVQLSNSIQKKQLIGVKANSEYDAYMKELIAVGRPTPILNINNLDNTEAILNYAIKREEDSILFYVGLKNYIDAINHDTIDTIIQEEAKHLVKIFLMKHL